MGQKVSPIGLRTGIIRDWESRWYAEDRDFARLLVEDVNIRNAIEKYYEDLAKKAPDHRKADAQISRIEIERTQNRITIFIRTAHPGVVIGAEGKSIDGLRNELQKLTGTKNISIKVLEIQNPQLDAHYVAKWIATELEGRKSFRATQKKAIQNSMRAGAKGIKTAVAGRLGGTDIARTEGYSEGVVPLHTLRSDIDYALVEAHTTYGRLGVKVWICRGEVLPGEMVVEPEAPKRSRSRNDRRRGGRRERQNAGGNENRNRGQNRREREQSENRSQNQRRRRNPNEKPERDTRTPEMRNAERRARARERVKQTAANQRAAAERGDRPERRKETSKGGNE